MAYDNRGRGSDYDNTRREAAHGVSFTTDMSKVGTGQSGSRLFGGAPGGGGSIVDEEKRLIDKVFSIVDRDNSGSVDMEELKEMFKLFGVQSNSLMSAIQRIMQNADQDFDGQIDPNEFYNLLSQRFEKGDPKSEIRSVFNRMDKDNNQRLDIDELHEVSQMLGENISKKEIKEMIKTFDSDYQTKLQTWLKEKKKNPHLKPPEEPDSLGFEDFYNCMQEEL
jgi:Ca2+-binding EF-hand superfamily protein